MAIAWIEGFVHPALAAGAALAIVPLVIHLLNRQRHRPVRWAAMRFVLAAYRRTRRRVEFENLLLLLLRMGAIALIALALARPFTGTSSPLAKLTEARRDVALVLDASASTGYREGGRSVFERIVARAREIALELDGGRGDRVHLVTAGARARLLSWTDPHKALAMLETLDAPTDERLDLTAALGEVLAFAREEAAGTGTSAIEVRLLTDLQRSAFVAEPESEEREPGGLPADVARQLDALAELGVTVTVEDLGPKEAVPPNLGIVAIEPTGPVLGPGAPVELSVRVANHGDAPRAGVRVALSVDGQRRPIEIIDVPARASTEAIFSLSLRTPGDHIVEASLTGDRLAVDDSRVRLLRVPPPTRVLVVDGDPAAEIDRDETGLLMAVLEPPIDDEPTLGDGAPFLPRRVSPGELETGEVDLDEHDVIWLANVPVLTSRVEQSLRQRVARGGALVVSLGDRVQAETWNRVMFAPDGSRLLPAELVAPRLVASRRGQYWRAGEADFEHPALAFFAEERWRPLFTEVPFFGFWSVRPLESARVLARLDDTDRSPLLIERGFDRGRVYLWTSTIDPAWTRLPESPRSLVPFVHELVRHAVASDASAPHLAPGELPVAEVEVFPRAVELVAPGERRRRLEGEAVEVAPGRWRLPPLEPGDTARVGAYAIEVEGSPPVRFVVRLDPREGDLSRLLPGELTGLHPALALLRASEESADAASPGEPRRGELWRAVAAAALAFLVLESMWAAWLGRKRRIAP